MKNVASIHAEFVLEINGRFGFEAESAGFGAGDTIFDRLGEEGVESIKAAASGAFTHGIVVFGKKPPWRVEREQGQRVNAALLQLWREDRVVGESVTVNLAG